jgi:LPS-assembly lipoprotein
MRIVKPGVLALVLVLTSLLAGCGFQLRGTADLPFNTIYVPPANQPGVALDLRRNIQAGTRTTVVDDPKAAEAVIEFTEESRNKAILSLTGGGKVSEFELQYRLSFRVRDQKGGEFVPSTSLFLKRSVTFSDSDILAKETEDRLIYRTMEADMVNLIMRRLEVAQRPKPEAR